MARKTKRKTVKQEPDWKAIATALGQRVVFAISHLNCSGSGMVGDPTDKTSEAIKYQHWRFYFADALKMIPGVTVDEEMIETFNLPAREKRKAQEALLKKRSAKGTK